MWCLDRQFQAAEDSGGDGLFSAQLRQSASFGFPFTPMSLFGSPGPAIQLGCRSMAAHRARHVAPSHQGPHGARAERPEAPGQSRSRTAMAAPVQVSLDHVRGRATRRTRLGPPAWDPRMHVIRQVCDYGPRREQSVMCSLSASATLERPGPQRDHHQRELARPASSPWRRSAPGRCASRRSSGRRNLPPRRSTCCSRRRATSRRARPRHGASAKRPPMTSTASSVTPIDYPRHFERLVNPLPRRPAAPRAASNRRPRPAPSSRRRSR